MKFIYNLELFAPLARVFSQWGKLTFILGLICTSAFAQPVADFTADTTSGCASSPLLVRFQDLSTGNPTTWFWNFGDPNTGATATGQNPGYTYTEPGCYEVTLTVTNLDGSDTETKTCFIEIFDIPQPDFNFTADGACAPLNVQFTDITASGGTPNEWFWSFSDGSFSQEQNPTITFTQPGPIDLVYTVSDDNGCINTAIFEDVLEVFEGPTLDFTADNTSACNPPLNVTFTNNTVANDAGNLDYIWQFENGNPVSSTLQNPPTVTYDSPGSYTVTLITNSSRGCRDTLVRTNFLGVGNVSANFTSDVTQVCQGEPVTFQNTSTGGVTDFVWNFGDGDTSSLANPVHTYDSAGTYSIQLQALNSDGCGDTVTVNNLITVTPLPEANFTVDKLIDCQVPATFNFTDQSAGAVTWLWDFGDSTTSTAPNPSHTYTAFGEYQVSLTITNANGCQASFSLDSILRVEPPEARFAIENTDGCSPIQVTFTNQSTSPSDSIVSWTWDFPGGTPSTSDSDTTVTVDYAGTGIFPVTLVITTAGGCTDTARSSAVRAGILPDTVDFMPDTILSCIRNGIQFSRILPANPDTSNYEYSWDFEFNADSGFNEMSTEPDPFHSYSDTGTFNVALIVNYFGCRDTLIKDSLVTILAPRAQFGISDSALCNLPQAVDLDDMTLKPEDLDLEYEWLLDNVLVGTDSLFNQVTINTGGPHVVELRVLDVSTGCADTTFASISSGSPIADFVVDDRQDCRQYLTADQITNTSQNADSYFWSFSNGETSTEVIPNVVLSDTGFYDVQLIARDIFGCTDTLNRAAYIEVIGPYIDLQADNLTGCPPLEVQFTDLSVTSQATTITEWRWIFGDSASGAADTSLLQNPTHIYTDPGQYDVRLTVTDDQGCKNSELLTALVDVTFPVPDFAVDDSSTCPGNVLNFINSSQGRDLTYEWDFGDGSPISNQETPSHAYDNPGTYTVSLLTTDVNGCVDSITKTDFIVVEDFTVDFEGDPISRFCPTLNTTFTDLSTGTIAAWDWSFGDGLPNSPLQDPSHSYTRAGSFEVGLTVTHEDGCTLSTTKPGYITVGGPEGEFEVEPADVCLGDTVTITMYTLRACSIVIDFRDGNLSPTLAAQCDSLVTDTTVVEYVYRDANIYSPLITLQDGGGCPVFLDLPTTIQVHDYPQASFTPQDTLGCAPFTVPFLDTSTPADSLGVITEWEWDFGNGDSSTNVSATTVFSDLGTSNVELIVTDNFGCKDTVVQTVTTVQGIQADFTVSDTVGCAPLAVEFTDQSQQVPAVAWSWDFGDGNSSTDQNPIHTYQDNGSYNVSLTVVDSLGCADSLAIPDLIRLASPEVSISASEIQGCNPVPVTFFAEAISENTIRTYEWCITDSVRGFVGCFQTEREEDSLVYTFIDAGTYFVSVTATDIVNCSATSDTLSILVRERVDPPVVIIESVSVDSDTSVFVSFEPYTGTDFTQYLIYRSDGGGAYSVIDSISDLAASTYLDRNGLNTREIVYCYVILVENFCRDQADLSQAAEHCTIELSTTPDIDAIQLDWTPYVGWTVSEYEILRTDNYDGNNVVSLGRVPGNQLFFVDDSTICRDSISYRILAYENGVDPAVSFSDLSISAPIHPEPDTPVHVLLATVVADSFVSVNWEPYNGYNPEYYLIERSTDGAQWDSILAVPISTLGFADNDVNVDENSYYYRITVVDECGDRTPRGRVGRTINLDVEFGPDNRPVLTWNFYQEWPNGIRNYDIEIFNDVTGNWELVEVVSSTENTFVDFDTDLVQPEYCYRILAYEAGGQNSISVSNEDCVIFGPAVYAPNAFSPNGDGDNEVFTIVSPNVEIAVLSVYNRWGKLLWRTLNVERGWDGTFNGVPVPEGVYVYVYEAIGTDNTPFTRSGTVTLIR